MPATKKRKNAVGKGRPDSPWPKRYQLRSTEAMFEAWLKASGAPAGSNGGDLLQHWIRTALNAAAGYEE